MRGISILVFILAGLAAHAQSTIDSYFATSGKQCAWDTERSRLNDFVSAQSVDGGTDQKHLRKTFRKVHSTFLKKYDSYSSFGEIFNSGRYDCLTATALFAHVLKELGYSYEIIETNYHIFLVVNTDEGRVLLETTDRFGGLITNERKIVSRIDDYGRNTPVAAATAPTYLYSFNLLQPISEDKLTGLLYFNQAVSAYNSRHWLESAKTLEQAYQLYKSERCEELGAIVLQTVLETPMDEEARSACLQHLGNFWLKRSEIFAAN